MTWADQEVEIESIRKLLARAADTGYSMQRIANACAELALVVWQ
jgi:hypothetical protein